MSDDRNPVDVWLDYMRARYGEDVERLLDMGEVIEARRRIEQGAEEVTFPKWIKRGVRDGWVSARVLRDEVTQRAFPAWSEHKE